MKQQSYLKLFLFSILSFFLFCTTQAFAAVPEEGDNTQDDTTVTEEEVLPQEEEVLPEDDENFFTEEELADIEEQRQALEGDAAASNSGRTMIVEHANQAYNEERCGGEADEDRFVHVRSYSSSTATGDTRSGNTRYYLTYERVYDPNSEDCVMEYRGRRRDGGCFAPETMVMMGDKSLKKIDEIREGDFVWNPSTEKAQKVAHVVLGPEKESLIEVGYGDSKVRVTKTHPMVVSNSQDGFAPVALRDSTASANSKVIKASELTKDHLILGADGEFHQITTLQELAAAEGQYVYNVELEADSHDIAKHLLVADGIVTGDVRIQSTLNNQALPWDAK